MTPFILTAQSADLDVDRRGGGKGANLKRLTAAGLRVPDWAILGTDALELFLRAGAVRERIELALSRLTGENVERVALEIAALFEQTELDPLSRALIDEALERVGAVAVAVRSSGTDEDGSSLSFAGQYASFLNVVGAEAVGESVKRCWASACSARALTYRTLHRVQGGMPRMAVILQTMVPAATSGVAFTRNPVSGRDGEMLISAVHGLGEGLVSGVIDADNIVLDRQTGRVTSSHVGDKRERLSPAASGSGCTLEELEPAPRDSLALSPAEIAALHRACLDVEASLGAGQDIEWAIADGACWILQARPITTGPEPAAEAVGGELRIWDNSNIIESYGDITAPLTFSFARHLYHRVYTEYCALLGVPKAQLAEMDDWLRSMLGYFNGRVYYNLLNWYKVTRLLPFYGLNRRVLEWCMGVQEPLDDELAEQQRPLHTDSRGAELALRAWIAAHFAVHFFTIERSVDRFVRHFYRVHDEYDAAEYSGLPANEVYRRFTDVEHRLMTSWGRMILLESVIGLSYGVLQALTVRWLPDAPESFQWEVARVEEEVESARPVLRMRELAELIRADDGLRALVAGLPDGDGYVTLTRASAGDASARSLLDGVDAYLAEFGYRNVNELKLEEPDLRENPAPLFALLKGTVAQLDAAPVPETTSGGADAYLDEHLDGWRRRAYGVVRLKVRRALAARERVRFCRTRVFGLARRMFKAMGEDLARSGALASPADVFYLRLEELRACFEGTLSERELAPLVSLRRAQEAESRALTAPPRFRTTGAVYGREVDAAFSGNGAAPLAEAADGRLRGTPCSPGVVVGSACVIDEPRDVGGGVLVAYRTDPGWITALTSASALLIERGSPLTHVAIVARELGIPTIVQIPGLTQRVRTGAAIRVDGAAGTVEFLTDTNGNGKEAAR